MRWAESPVCGLATGSLPPVRSGEIPENVLWAMPVGSGDSIDALGAWMMLTDQDPYTSLVVCTDSATGARAGFTLSGEDGGQCRRAR